MMADRISNLPNEVLCHILSFLPTKASVATCVLSKRWKLLWRSVPALDFDDSSYYDFDIDDDEIPYSRFVQSVYAFIISRDLDQPLRRFSLRCFSLGDQMNVNAWLTAAAQRSVESLHLSRCLSIDFPSALRSCRTLVTLKLKGLNVRSLSSVHFPSLKILHLNRVDFSERMFLAELLAGTPNLEDLEAKKVCFSSYEIEAKFRRLPKLVRAVIVRFIVPLKVVDNVRFMRIKSIDEELIDIEDRIPEFNNLTHLEIGHLEYTRDWLKVLEVLKHCPKLQNFAINHNSIEEWFSEGDEGNWRQPQHVPQCISQNLKTCCLNDYGDFEADFEIAKYIMKSARQLQDMTIRSFTLADEPAKLEMLTKLSLCTRLSPNCKLSFN